MIDRRQLLVAKLALLSIQMDPDLDTDCALAWAEGLIDCRATRVAEARVSGVLSQSPYVPSPVREAAVEMCQLLSDIATGATDSVGMSDHASANHWQIEAHKAKGRAEKAEAERDEALAMLADLREAGERLADAIAYERLTHDGDVADIPGPGALGRLGTAERLAREALADTAAAATRYRARVEAEALEEVATKIRERLVPETPGSYRAAYAAAAMMLCDEAAKRKAGGA